MPHLAPVVRRHDEYRVSRRLPTKVGPPVILHLIATYGYLVVLAVVMAESAGLPLPGETSLLIAGAFAATGHLWLPGVIAAAALGAILGDTAGYWVGRTYGLAFLRRHGKLLRFDEAKLRGAEAFFARHGEKTVFLGRFVPIGRIFSAVLAGVSRMHYRRFLAWNAAGGITWAALMGTVGFLFGQHLALLELIVRRAGFALLAALIVAVAIHYAVRHRAALRARWQQLGASFAHRAEGHSPGGMARAALASITRGFAAILPSRRWRIGCATGAGLALLAAGMVACAGLLDVM